MFSLLFTTQCSMLNDETRNANETNFPCTKSKPVKPKPQNLLKINNGNCWNNCCECVRACVFDVQIIFDNNLLKYLILS